MTTPSATSTASRFAPQQQVSHEFLVRDWKPKESGTLQGIFTVELPSGLILKGCTLHTKNAARWVAMPAQKYQPASGQARWISIIEFRDEDSRRRFQTRALAALDRLLCGESRQ